MIITCEHCGELEDYNRIDWTRSVCNHCGFDIPYPVKPDPTRREIEDRFDDDLGSLMDNMRLE